MLSSVAPTTTSEDEVTNSGVFGSNCPSDVSVIVSVTVFSFDNVPLVYIESNEPLKVTAMCDQFSPKVVVETTV